jgi:hypothetical protein
MVQIRTSCSSSSKRFPISSVSIGTATGGPRAHLYRQHPRGGHTHPSDAPATTPHALAPDSDRPGLEGSRKNLKPAGGNDRDVDELDQLRGVPGLVRPRLRRHRAHPRPPRLLRRPRRGPQARPRQAALPKVGSSSSLARALARTRMVSSRYVTGGPH